MKKHDLASMYDVYGEFVRLKMEAQVSAEQQKKHLEKNWFINTVIQNEKIQKTRALFENRRQKIVCVVKTI